MRQSSWILGSVLILGGFGLVATPTAAGGRCVTAAVEETILLPGGVEHPPGILTICDSHRYSPVASLHHIRVDGKAIALAVSRRQLSEGSDDDRPFLMFIKDGRGRMHLYGYATPKHDKLISYRLDDPLPGLRTAAQEGTTPPDEPALLLASTGGR